MPTEISPVDEFEAESDAQSAATAGPGNGHMAFVHGNDWTAATLADQLKRQNILLTPKFQRRDAWRVSRKSLFIESLIVGLPIPQIVLAESKTNRGKFIVLDGKQRLLSIQQFWGLGEGGNNRFSLVGMDLRRDLQGKTFVDFENDPLLADDLNSLMNQPIRTVVIRNWKDTDFLHTVFLRLNTGSVSLSAQELRQALLPGPFSDFVENYSGNSRSLRRLLGCEGPDPRMRDAEILARFLAFFFFAKDYPGRMKRFLDDTFRRLNLEWDQKESEVQEAVNAFEIGVGSLIEVFGGDLAKKPQSGQFNRAIFDALIYFHSRESIRKLVKGKSGKLRSMYKELFYEGSPFVEAIESDTAGAPHTAQRMKVWAGVLSKVSGKKVLAPNIPVSASSE